MNHITFKKKDNNKFIFLLAFVICICAQKQLSAQETKDLKNSIKVNLTAQLLYKNAWQLSYERILKKNRSLNIYGGYNEFPANVTLNLENTQFANSGKKSGYMFGVDYRFYLAKENKYSAPHGIYLAPFISFYQFNGERQLIYTDSAGGEHPTNSHTDINFLNIGGQLGYQFVFGKRWVLDAVVFGPAYTHYKFKAKIDGPIPGQDQDETLKAIIDALKEKFPLLNDLSKDHEVDQAGTEAFWSVGFRYNISIGFRF
jgi:hypothetical protein